MPMAQVKLILREDVEKLGHAGDLVAVKPGYARNYLLRQGKASIATEARVNELEHHRRIISEQQAKALKDLDALKKQIESQVIEVEAQAGIEGKLFGSVTLQQVADLLAEKGFALDRRKMQVAEPIKTVGEHYVEVRLHRELVAKVKVVVEASGVVAEPEEEEAPEEAEIGSDDDDAFDRDDDED
jgi:large subunit ribosomal protein L9